MAEEAAGQARATLRRLRAGTERMAETGQQVEGMQRELAEMQPLLAAAKAKVRRVGGGAQPVGRAAHWGAIWEM